MRQSIDRQQDDASNTVIIDKRALDDIRALRHDGAPDPLGMILTRYLDATPPALTSLAEAAAAGDCETVKQIAHSIKSSSAAVGAVTLAQICRDLELQAIANNPDGFQAFAAQSLEAYELAASELRAELSR